MKNCDQTNGQNSKKKYEDRCFYMIASLIASGFHFGFQVDSQGNPKIKLTRKACTGKSIIKSKDIPKIWIYWIIFGGNKIGFRSKQKLKHWEIINNFEGFYCPKKVPNILGFEKYVF